MGWIDSLDKIEEYQGAELIYADGKNIITHKVDGPYSIDPVSNQEDKILDYDGAVQVYVRDGLLSVGRLGNELLSDFYKEDEQELYWGTGTLLIKKYYK